MTGDAARVNKQLAHFVSRIPWKLPSQYVDPCADLSDMVEVLTQAPGHHVCMGAYESAGALDIYTSLPVVTRPPQNLDALFPLLDHWIGFNVCTLLLNFSVARNAWFAPYEKYITDSVDFFVEPASKDQLPLRLCWCRLGLVPGDGKMLKGT